MQFLLSLTIMFLGLLISPFNLPWRSHLPWFQIQSKYVFKFTSAAQTFLPFRPIYFSYLKLSLTGTELFLPYPHKIQNKLCLLQCFFVLFFISQQHQHPSFSFQSSLTSSLLSHIEPQSLSKSTSE